MAFFQLFQLWRPLSQRGLPKTLRLKLQSCQAFDCSTEGFVRFLARKVVEKLDVFCEFLAFSGSVSADFRHFFENDPHRGQPLAKFFTEQTIWHVSRVFSFLWYLVQK